jgi:hypothetical protein
MAVGLTSVRGNRGENNEKGTAGSPKTYKEKKTILLRCLYQHSVSQTSYVMTLVRPVGPGTPISISPPPVLHTLSRLMVGPRL